MLIILKYWKVVTLCVLVGTFYGYGVIKYRSGYKDAQEALKLKIERVTIKEIKEAGQDKEKIRHVEENLDDNAVNDTLTRLGIMRRNDDR